jgi:alpha-tubulin suppressor-like RCC1 family protein
MDRDLQDALGHGVAGKGLGAGSLIKIKDLEGKSAFELYNSSIITRALSLHRSKDDDQEVDMDSDSTAEDSRGSDRHSPGIRNALHGLDGDELFTFGSNKNLTLGHKNEDDRTYPERVHLNRPDHLLHRFYNEQKYAKQDVEDEVPGPPDELTHRSTSALPALVQNKPIVIMDVVLSKLHTAILTTDPESNLYICGFGPGGRLGTGDQNTRYTPTCIEGGGLDGKRVATVALGQNHTIAVTDEGEIYTWGTNTFGQLGYTLPTPAMKDDEPMQLSPRQLFGPLKREIVCGAAASRIHSVAHTGSSLYTFGKNDGQLGLVDSDARSLEMQMTPRKVAASLFSSPIRMVAAIDRATTCLLESNEVCVCE